MSARPLRVDQLAARVFGRAAMAAGMGDRDLALEVCRELGEIESAYELRMRTAESVKRERGTVFVGRPMESKLAGRCVVCSGAIEVGAPILYNREQRRAAHNLCGEIAA